MSRESPHANREELLAQLSEEFRRMGIDMVMFHQAIADALGVHVTDSRAFSLLQLRGPMTAGQLAEATGLTTSAVTTIVDRLERAGLVRRESDLTDRRRVIVQPVSDPEGNARRAALFQSVHSAFLEHFGQYGEEDLRRILDFVERTLGFLREETIRLREQDPTDLEA